MKTRTRLVLVVVLAATVAAAGVVFWQRRGSDSAATAEKTNATDAVAVVQPVAVEQPMSPTDRVQAALARDVSFPGYDDPKAATLADVLKSMGKQWGVRFDVNGKDAELIMKLEIASPPIPPMSMPADWVLLLVLERTRKVFGRVEFLAYKDHIVIATDAWFAEQDLVPYRPSVDTPRMVAKARALREKLSKVINFPRIDDVKTTLGDFFELIHRRWDVKSICSEASFKREGLSEVMKTEIANPPLPSIRAPLYDVIEKILSRIPIPSGATFTIVGDHLLIGTNDDLQGWEVDSEPPPKATERMKKQFEVSRAVLVRTVSFPGVVDSKSTLGAVLDQFGKTHGLTIEVEEDQFRRQGIRVLEMDVAGARPIPAMKASAAKILDIILDRISFLEEGRRATYIVRDGIILVTVGPAQVLKD